MIYSLDRFYQQAYAEKARVGKAPSPTFSAGSMYAVRFVATKWLEDDLSYDAGLFALLKISRALSVDFPDYDVRGVTLQRAPSGKTYDMARGDAIFFDIDRLQTDNGTWLVDVVFSPLSDVTVWLGTNYKKWAAYVRGVMGSIGYRAPDVQVMGCVTVDCPEAQSNAMERLYACFDTAVRAAFVDPDPDSTEATRQYWRDTEPIWRVTAPSDAQQKQADAENDPQKKAALLEPTVTWHNVMDQSHPQGLAGTGGRSFCLGLYDAPSALSPIQYPPPGALVQPVEPPAPPLDVPPGPEPEGPAEASAAMPVAVLSLGVLVGFLIWTQWSKMRP